MLSLLALSFTTLVASQAAAAPQTFGKPLTGLAPTTLAAVLERPEAGRMVALEGTIRTVCQGKGCWLTFEQDDKSVHVSFEGYSFFVPKDSAGQKVKLEGRVVMKQRTKEQIEHLEKEGARGVSLPVSIEAVGVVIEKAAK